MFTSIQTINKTIVFHSLNNTTTTLENNTLTIKHYETSIKSIPSKGITPSILFSIIKGLNLNKTK